MNFSLNQLQNPAFDLSEEGAGIGLNNTSASAPTGDMSQEQQQQTMQQQQQQQQQQMLMMQYQQAMAAQATAQQQGGAYSPVHASPIPASPAMSAAGQEESKTDGLGGGVHETVAAAAPPSERVLSAESDPNAAPPRMLKDKKKHKERMRNFIEEGDEDQASNNSSVDRGGGSDDEGGYGSESDGGKSGGDNASVGSDASHLTEPPMEGGFVHYGWSYAAYLDRIERIERFPDQLLELRKGYDEARERVMGSSQMILRGAAERRAFFVKQTGVGANALEPIDEGEVHRLSRDSIRRRYEQERQERKHDVARDNYLGYVASFVEQTILAKQERDRIREMLRPSPPGTPSAVEIGYEFLTIEWLAPERGSGDVTMYEIAALDLSDDENAEGGEGGWKLLVELEREYSRASQIYTLNDLKQGKRYLLRVRALNSAGWSEWSEPCAEPLQLSTSASMDSRGIRKSILSRSRRRKSDLGRDLGQGEEDLEWLESLFDDLSKVVEKNPGSVSELFAKFDRKNKGVVDRRDVAETLREVFTLSLKEDQLDRLLHEFDPDDSGDIEYKEFIGAIEAYSFRSMVERKKKSTSGDAIRALQSATHHSSRDLDNFSDEGSTDSFESDQLRRSLDDFDPSADVGWDYAEATGLVRLTSGANERNKRLLRKVEQSGMTRNSRKEDRARRKARAEARIAKKQSAKESSDEFGTTSVEEFESAYLAESSGERVFSQRRFEKLGPPGMTAMARRLGDILEDRDLAAKASANQDVAEKRGKSSLAAAAIAKKKEKMKGSKGGKASKDGNDEKNSSKSGNEEEEAKVGLEAIAHGFLSKSRHDEFVEDYIEELDDRMGFIKHDPLRNMPRAEVSVRLGSSTSVGISPVIVTPDDLGRLVVASCRDVVHQAGVLPGFHLVKVGKDAVWPPSKRRITRKHAIAKLWEVRPIRLVFERCYPIRKHHCVFTRKDIHLNLGFTLEQHRDTHILYIDKVEASSAAKSLGLAPNDVIVDMNNLNADTLEKWGVKSSKMMKLLIERPLDLNVARGLPLHQLLLPARVDNDPDAEKKIKNRIKQGKSKRAVADSNQRSAAREEMRRPSMFATDSMHSLQKQTSGLGSHDSGYGTGGGNSSADSGGGGAGSGDEGGYGGGGANSRGGTGGGSTDKAAASVRSRKNRGSVWGAARASLAMGVFHTPSGGDVTGSGGASGGGRRAGRGSIFDSMNAGNHNHNGDVDYDYDSDEGGEEGGVSTRPKKGGWAKLRAAHTLNVGAKAALKANHSSATSNENAMQDHPAAPAPRGSITALFGGPNPAALASLDGSAGVGAGGSGVGISTDGQTEDIEVSVATPHLGCGIKDAIGGVVVVSLVEGGEGERLGMKIGDLIHSVGAKTHFKPGAPVTRSAFLYKFQREKRPTTLMLTRQVRQVYQRRGSHSGSQRRQSAGSQALEALRRSSGIVDMGEADENALAVAKAMLGGAGTSSNDVAGTMGVRGFGNSTKMGSDSGAARRASRDGRVSFGSGEAFWEPREVTVTTGASDPANKGKDPIQVACGGAALERSADGRTLSVVAVEAYSPCAVAGVKAGDVLILANGERLASFVSSGGKKKGKKQTSFKDDPASSSTAAESIDLPRPVLMSSPSFSMAAPLVSELAKTLSIIKKPYKLTLVRRVHGEKTGISNSFASQAAVATAAAAQGPTTEGGAGGGGSGDSWAKPGGGFKAALKRASAAHKAAKGFGGATNDDLAAGFVDYSKQQRRNSASASNSMDNAATRVVVVFPEKVETWSSLKLEVAVPPASMGVLTVTTVDPKGPAGLAGLKPGDQVMGTGSGPRLGPQPASNPNPEAITQWAPGKLSVLTFQTLLCQGTRPALVIVQRPSATAAAAAAGASSGAEVKPPTFEVGEVVQWKGSDDDLPSGTQGRVELIHDDGDVEVSFPPKSLAGSGERRRFTFHPARLDRPRDVAARAQATRERSAQAAQAVKAFAEEQARAAKSAQGSSSSGAGGANSNQSTGGSSNGGLSRQRSMTEILNEKREQWELYLPPKVAAALESSAMKALEVVTKGASSVLVLANMLTSEALSNDDEYAEVCEDIRLEASAFGEVVEVFVPRPGAGDVHGIGKVYVEFSDSVGAVAAAEGLGGRDFDGRTIQTAFLDEAAWDNGELDDHTTPV